MIKWNNVFLAQKDLSNPKVDEKERKREIYIAKENVMIYDPTNEKEKKRKQRTERDKSIKEEEKSTRIEKLRGKLSNSFTSFSTFRSPDRTNFFHISSNNSSFFHPSQSTTF